MIVDETYSWEDVLLTIARWPWHVNEWSLRRQDERDDMVVPWTIIVSHPEVPWNVLDLAVFHPKFDLSWLHLHPCLHTHGPLVSCHLPVTIVDIVYHPTYDWEWDSVCAHVQLRDEDMDVLCDHVHTFPWNWDQLVSNQSLRLHHVEQNPQLPWSRSNSLLTQSFVLDMQ